MLTHTNVLHSPCTVVKKSVLRVGHRNKANIIGRSHVSGLATGRAHHISILDLGTTIHMCRSVLTIGARLVVFFFSKFLEVVILLSSKEILSSRLLDLYTSVHMQPRCLTAFANTNQSHNHGSRAQFVGPRKLTVAQRLQQGRRSRGDCERNFGSEATARRTLEGCAGQVRRVGSSAVRVHFTREEVQQPQTGPWMNRLRTQPPKSMRS